MTILSSFTSPLRIAALITGTVISLAACGGGGADSAQSPTPKMLATAGAVNAVQAPATIRMHYHRAQGDTAQWGVYSWDGPVTPSPAWITGRFMMTSTDAFGGYVDIPVNTAKTAIHFLVTDGNGNKNCGNDQAANFNADIPTVGQQVWMLEGDCTVYATQPAISFGNLNKASALWLSTTTLAWPGVPTTGSYRLYYAANAGLGSDVGGVTGADGSFALTAAAALPAALKDKFPNLASATALTLADADAATIASHAIAQFAIAQFDASGKLMQVTSLQMADMLDTLFAPAAANSKLGVSFDQRGIPTFRVWAPTAKSVALNLYPNPNDPTTFQVAMNRDNASGVWSYTASDASWTNRYYYTYTVNVLSRWAGNTFVTNVVTDPYSLSLN
ncbi:MAG: DUF3372 domain-containing protein, partial [Pseudomonadota bacterium]|nr:DUF3372 domain-containing protein [Pseudomonadota bacterium]